MPTEKVKSHSIIYAGYEYQTLYGVYILCKWINSPNKYTRAKLEHDDDSDFTGIDDIVCELGNSYIEFYQVKYTHDQSKHSLSWDWLLERKGKTDKSRSILKKFYDCFFKAKEKNKNFKITLSTNRIPDELFSESINKNKIIFEKISCEIVEKIKKELGTSESINFFIENLTIDHSNKSYLNLESQIKEQILNHTDLFGFQKLLIEASKWAKFKNSPRPDGWITYDILKKTLSNLKLQTINQSFEIPESYVIPNIEFHDKIKGLTAKNSIIVISGSPGIGKSTYLSYLHNELKIDKTPTIRHHYFISTTNNESSRFSPRTISQSLLNQIEYHYGEDIESHISPNKPEELRKALQICGKFAKSINKKFVIIIDGLDHVWRDNNNDKTPLDELFKTITPTPEGCCIIVGTQPVGSHMLPAALLQHAPINNWIEMPNMNLGATYSYIENCVKKSKLTLPKQYQNKKELLSTCATALHQITGGHPLHTIYSCEHLSNNNTTLSEWAITQLPPCSSGNISHYYSGLWLTLTHKQRIALHISCAIPMHWPANAFDEIFPNPTNEHSLTDGILHLMLQTHSGLRPFHESLSIFVKNRPEHSETIANALPAVSRWLNDTAPLHLKDTWLWQSIAMTGNTTPLRQGLSWEWIIEKLSEGIPSSAIERLLSSAERSAFKEGCYSEALEHRIHKHRIAYGPEYQTPNFKKIIQHSLSLSTKEAIYEAMSNHYGKSIEEISAISLAARHKNLHNESRYLAKNAYKKYLELINIGSKEVEHQNIDLLIESCICNKVIDINIICNEGRIDQVGELNLKTTLNSLCESIDIDTIINIFNHTQIQDIKIYIEKILLRLSISENFNLNNWIKKFNTETTNILKSFLQLTNGDYTKTLYSTNTYAITDSEYKIDTTGKSYYEFFFDCLNILLSAKGSFSWVSPHATPYNEDITSTYYDTIKIATNTFIKIIDEESDFITHILKHINTINFKNIKSYNAKSDARKIISDIHEVMLDIQLITNKSKINKLQILQCLSHSKFNIFATIQKYSTHKIKTLTDSALECVLEQTSNIHTSKTFTVSDILEDTISLTSALLLHGINQQSKALVKKSWKLATGYGNHKDHSIFNILNSISHIANIDTQKSLSYLKSISKHIYNISEFTDGDDVSYAKELYTDILSRISIDTAISKYRNELYSEEWYYASNTFEKIIKTISLEDYQIEILSSTIIDDSEILTILDRKIEHSTKEKIKETFLRQTGSKISPLPITNTDNSETTHDFSTLPPDDINAILNEAESAKSPKKFLRAWYHFWSQSGQEATLIATISPYTDDTKWDGNVRYLLDPLAHSYTSFYGPNKALPYFIAAHNAMSGWGDWNHYESEEESLSRLKTIATYPPNKVQEFIQKTSQNRNKWDSDDITIPSHKLVFLLAESGEHAKAKTITDTMIKCLMDETEQIHLPTPDWKWDDNAQDRLTNLLLARLNSPVPYIKWITCEAIASLLLDDKTTTATLCTIYSEIPHKRLESETIEILSIFYIAHINGYQCSEELASLIKSRSILSDIIIDYIIKECKNYGEYRPVNYNSRYNQDLSINDIVGVELPRFFITRIKHLQDKSPIDLYESLTTEWTHSLTKTEEGLSNISFYFSDRTKKSGQFFTYNSHRARSSYLRTLNAALAFGGDYYTFNTAALLALPFEPVLLNTIGRCSSKIFDICDHQTINNAEIQTIILSILNDFELDYPDSYIGSLNYTKKIDNNNYISIELTLCASFKPKAIDDHQSSFLFCTQIDQQIKFISARENAIHDTIQLTTHVFPYIRYGFWQSDIFSRGFFSPSPVLGMIEAIRLNNDIIFKINNANSGQFNYRINEYSPTYIDQVGPNVDTCTTISKMAINAFISRNNMKLYTSCRIRKISRNELYSEFSTETEEFIHLK